MGSALGKLVGYGIWPYKPVCAVVCLRAVSSYMVSCSYEMEMHGGMHMHGNGMTSPQCRADDTRWLTTLAHCAKTKCAEFDVPIIHASFNSVTVSIHIQTKNALYAQISECRIVCFTIQRTRTDNLNCTQYKPSNRILGAIQ